MPFKTPDRFPGDGQEDAIEFYDQYGAMPEIEGEMLYSDGYFYAKDAYGVFNMRLGGDFLGREEHKTLRHLIHFIDDGPAGGFTSGAYREILPAGAVFPTSFTWYESSAKVKKIVELTVTYTGGFPTTEVWEMYDDDGTTVLVTVTDTISYSGAFETDRTRVIS
jgi:hypothetical protein